MTARAGRIRIGVSGWTYPPWRGHFYPKGLAQARELSYAASRFPALEINGTFYGLQKPDVFRRWAQATPADFCFAVKGPRFITHMLRLRDARVPLANFLASGVLNLGERLGPLLWQLPPSLLFDAGLIGDFLEHLPHDSEAAARLAREHDAHMDGRAATATDARRPMRHALEIRHDSFRVPAFVDLLRAHHVALVCADTVKWPRLMDVTADFVYCRLHGSRELYRSQYDDDELDLWARRIAAWSRGHPMREGTFASPETMDHGPRDVFVFFDNTDKLHAPDDARGLMDRLHVRWGEDHAESAA